MKFFLSALFVLISLTAPQVNAEIYQSTDSDGNISYSDSSTNPQAKKITPRPSNIVPAQPLSPKNNETKKNKSALQRHAIRITSPIDDIVIRDNQGKINIDISIQPPLIPENKTQVLIYFDGKVISQGQAMSTSMTNVDRGTHTIRAELVSPSGSILAQSNKVTVHLKKHSKIPIHQSFRY